MTEEKHRSEEAATAEGALGDAERDEMMKHLMEVCGISEREAELRLLDDDLWLLIPDSRISLEPMEAAIEWKNTLYWMRAIRNFAMMNLDVETSGLMQLICDAEERAEEALRRAKKRAEEERASAQAQRAPEEAQS